MNKKEDFFNKVLKTKSCWLWKGCTYKSGYGAFKIQNKQYRTHRFSWLIHNGNIPRDLYVLHKCDVRSCVNPKHLFLGTANDNLKDCLIKGRFKVASGDFHGTKTRPERIARGSRHGVSKLDELKVKNIRLLYNSGNHTHLSLANKFGVTEGCIQQIVQRKTWVHV